MFFAPTLAVSIAGAQTVPTRTLTKPEVEVRESFSWLEEGVREMRDGRVIVIVGIDDVIKIVDLAANTAATFSRKGDGPGEYRFPNQLFALPGDSTAMLESSWRRMLVILPNGKPGGFLSPRPSIANRTEGAQEIHAQRTDGRGRFYGSGAIYRMNGAVLQQYDSIAILRWALNGSRIDTVGYVAQPPNNVKASSRGNNHMISIGGGGGPFGPRDAWDVAPDGRVVVVSASTYSITWTDPNTGKRTTTAPIPHVKYPVTDAHKKQWMDQQRTGGGGVACGDNACSKVPMTRRPVQEPANWGGEFLPVFRAGESLSFDPDGMLWVKRSGPVGAPLTYDVIDRAGKLAQHVVFPEHVRLIGFGANGAIYAARTDDDDLQYLQRYR
ncbi:MAG TPA: hypothetical protein VJR92_06470 [Gemmatimonadaceae bacterium]|nr:hypothetical protein [Gemmatimonadaceae bacterium]